MKIRVLLVAFCILLVSYIIAIALLVRSNLAALEQSVVLAAPTPETPALDRGALFLDNDSYMWVLYAEQGLRDGSWRVHRTTLDNTPQGRAVHWNSAPIWFLASLGSLLAKLEGMSPRSSIELAAFWWNPFVHALLVVSATGLVWLRMGSKSAILVGLLLAALPGMQWLCNTARPGHHCQQILFVLLSCLLPYLGGMGWVRRSEQDGVKLLDYAYARRWFIAAGVVGGAGLWSGALIQSAVYGAFGVGILLGVFSVARNRAADGVYAPVLWRWWGWSGAVASMFFYLLEYAPFDFGMNLEVNHPWYAICLASAGEFLCQWSALWLDPSAPRPYLGRLVVSAILTLSLPIAVTFGPEQWHALRDVWMQRMHAMIAEFRPYSAVYGGQAWLRFWFTMGVLPLGIPLAIYSLRAHRLSPRRQMGIWMALLVSLFLLSAMLLQDRWEGFFMLSTVLLALVLWEAVAERAKWRGIVYVTLITQSALFGILTTLAIEKYNSQPASMQTALSVIAKKNAQQWPERPLARDLRVLSDPSAAPVLEYFSGASTLTSLYWENLEGLQEATFFMTDQGDAEARQIASRHKLTHVVVDDTPEGAKYYQYVRYGEENLTRAKSSLAGRLSRGQPPAWLHINDDLTGIMRWKYRRGDVLITQKFLVYDVDQTALNGEQEKN